MSVLIAAYHAIAMPQSPVCTPVSQLESDIAGLQRAGFTFVSLGDCAAWVAGRLELPESSVAITFDDAYESVVTLGLPVLSRFNVPATVFAIVGRLGSDNQWPGQWSSIPAMRLADASGLRALVSSGITLGCHTWSHPSLPEVTDKQLHREVVEAADHLEQVTGTAVQHFAYPYGHWGVRERQAVCARYVAAVTTEADVVGRFGNAASLPRVDCHDLRLALKLGFATNRTLRPYLKARRVLRTVRRTAGYVFG
jgi:peptidoglycan/xylan/chitin deacetylase (PgdA/CDA1 family)